MSNQPVDTRPQDALIRRDDIASGTPPERHVMSLRVGQCVNIAPVTRLLLIAGVLIAINPLLPRLIEMLPVFPYQQVAVWTVYLTVVGVPILSAIYRVLYSATCQIELSNKALRIRNGVFNQHHDHLALFRYRDHEIDRPLIQRLFRRGVIKIYAADRSGSTFLLPGIKHPVKVAETLNRLATEERALTGVHVVE